MVGITPLGERHSAPFMLGKVEQDQLLQIFHGATWDGDLISKDARDSLHKRDLIARHKGYNIITIWGVDLVLSAKLVVPGSK